MLREARQWFIFEFHPESFEDLAKISGTPRNASFRMVLSYWDMAASLVTTGAIGAASFLAANGEIVAAFSKVQPLLEKLRGVFQEPDFLKHMEAMIMAVPGAPEMLARRRERVRNTEQPRPAGQQSQE